MKGSPRKGHDERVNPKGHPAFSINENQSFNSTLKLNTLSCTLFYTEQMQEEEQDKTRDRGQRPHDLWTGHPAETKNSPNKQLSTERRRKAEAGRPYVG